MIFISIPDFLKFLAIDIATLFVREHTSKIKPRYSYKDINHDNWLLFPWETKASSK